MKYFYIIIILFGLYCMPTINCNPTCPIGKPTTNSTCGSCPPNSICYRKKNEDFCCGEVDKFCPTKLHSIRKVEYETYSWEPFESAETMWYNVELGSETIACPLPYSYAFIDYYEWKVLPIDFDSKTPGKSKPKACSKNSKCNMGNDEFCGASSHPTYQFQLDGSGKNGSPLTFCYKFQNLGSTNIKPIINAEKKELVGCDNHSDCFSSHGSESFCFTKKNSRVLVVEGGRNYTLNDGSCARANVCDLTKHGSISASLTKNNTFCQTNDDCQGSASAKKHPDMEPDCVAVPNVTESKMCCSKHKGCQFGTIELPHKPCISFKNCNNDVNELVHNKWCDENSKFCCQDVKNELWMCLDGATPLFNEPKCNNSSSLEIYSGTCPNEAGICKYGHCCPPLRRNDKNEFIIGDKHYVTNVACRASAPLPLQFNNAFCHPENKTIVIMGATNADGGEIPTGVTNSEAVPKKGKNCTFNKECMKGDVCAKLVTGDQSCIFNPLNKKPIPVRMKYDSLITWNAEKSEAKCNLCGHPMKKQIKNSTSGFKYHFEQKHTKEEIDAALKGEGSSEKRVVTQTASKNAKRALVDMMKTWQDDGSSSRELDEVVAMTIAIDGLPLNTTEKLGFRFLLHKLRPNYKPKMRTCMTTKILPDIYAKYKNMLKSELKICQKLSIGADIWSDEAAKHEVLGMTCIFMKNGEPILRLLSALPIENRHTGENIKKLFDSVLDDYDINGKVVGFVRDGGSNMVSACNMMQIPHYDCLLHKVSLAARAGVEEDKEMVKVIDKMKKFARKLRKSAIQRKSFEDCQELMDLPVYSLKKSIDIRWLSVFDMAERFLQLKEPLKIYQITAPAGFPQLEDHDFDLIGVLVENLQPLKTSIIRAQESFFPASATIPFLMSLIKKLEPTPVSRCSKMLSASSAKLTLELEKYLKNDTILLATAVDPRFKLTLLEDSVKNILLERMKEVSDIGFENEQIGSETKEDDLFSGILPNRFSNVTISTVESTSSAAEELEKWTRVHHSTSENPFIFWSKNENQKNFPRLFIISQDLLALPATSVDAERAFSSARHILTDYRKQLSPSNFSMILFLNQNLPRMCPQMH